MVLRLFLIAILIPSVFLLNGQSLDLDIINYSQDTTGLFKSLDQERRELNRLPQDKLDAQATKLWSQIAKSPNKAVRLRSFWIMGLYMQKRGANIASINFIESALQLAEESKSPEYVDVANTLGEVYSKIGQPGKSLDVLTKALAIFEEQGEFENQMNSLTLLANLYFKNEEYVSCIQTCRTIDSLSQINRAKVVGYIKNIWINSWNTSGLAYFKMKNYPKAIQLFDQTIQIANENHVPFLANLAKGNQAAIFLEQGDFKRALGGMMQDFRVSLKEKEFENAANSALALTEIYRKLGRHDLARAYLDTAYLLKKPTLDPYAVKYYNTKSNLAADVSQFSDAYRFLQKANAIKDTIDKSRNPALLLKTIGKANIAEREKNIELLNNKSLLQEKQLELRNFIIIFSVALMVLLLIFSVLLYKRFKQKQLLNKSLQEKNDEIEAMLEEIQSQNETLSIQKDHIGILNSSLEQQVAERTSELARKNQELDTYIYRASHDIRRPITTILGLSNLMRKAADTSSQTDMLGLIAHLNSTAQNMDNMLHKMRMIYELEQDGDSTEEVDIKSVIQNTLAEFERSLTEQQIQVTVQCEVPNLITYKTCLVILFKNLIENSIQFQKPLEEKKRITITVTRGETILVKVEDNGIGIEPSHLPYVFDLYFRGSSKSIGNGLGLYLAKKAMDKMGGTIQVESSYGEGAKFIMSFPLP